MSGERFDGGPTRRARAADVLFPGRARRADETGRPPAIHGLDALRATTSPGWLLFHLVVAALFAVFVAMGLWQYSESAGKGFDLFNFQYAIQWWLFAAFGAYAWVRVILHRLRPPAPRAAVEGTLVAFSGGVDAGTSRGELTAGAAGSALARTSPGAVARPVRSGPAEMISPRGTDGEPAVRYRGYVPARSAQAPVRSHGDAVHDSYNDYLWHLAMADGETPGPDADGPDAGHDA